MILAAPRSALCGTSFGFSATHQLQVRRLVTLVTRLALNSPTPSPLRSHDDESRARPLSSYAFLFPAQAQIEDSNDDSFTELSRTAIRRMRVADLRNELGRRGLNAAGKRDELIARLIEDTESIFSSVTRLQGIVSEYSPDDSNNPQDNELTALDPDHTYILRVRAHTKTSYGCAGVGIVLYDLQELCEVWAARKFFPTPQPWFDAEYRGLFLGLKYARARGIEKLMIQTDNDVMVGQLRGDFQVGKEELQPLYWQSMELMDSLKEVKICSIISAENSRAANLARRAVFTKKSLGFDSDDEEDRAASSPLSQEEIVLDHNGIEHLEEQDQAPISPEKTYLLRFDGGARVNIGIAGSGMVLYEINTGLEIWCGWKFLERKATNNEAEYMGLLVGLQCARSLGIRNLRVEGDSEFVVKQILGEYRVRKHHIKKMYLACKEIIDSLDHFEVAHIFREQNVRADELANHAMNSRESYGFV